MRAIVLSGGGSLGSYQIGVWKALRHLHIKYDIVTGTSIGALNGALMVQKNYYKALQIWKKINMQILFGDEIAATNNKEVFKMFRNEFLKNGGIEVKKVEEVIEKYINKSKFYNSNIDYGLVTVNLSKKKPLFLTKDKIKEEKLTSYLMASASCYPAFKPKEIDKEKYVDGGYIDNMPINLAIDLGADEVIAVDLNSPGIKFPTKKKIKITTIKPNNKLSFFLNFNEEGAKRNMQFGYNDAMKKFGKLEGKKYTFKKGQIEKCKNKYQVSYEEEFKKILNTKKMLNQVISSPLLGKVRNKKYLLTMLEELGKMFELEETKIYTYKEFNKLLNKQVEIAMTNKNKMAITKLLKSKIMILDMYDKLKKGKRKAVRNQAVIAPNDFLKALYLYTINEN